MLMQKTMSFITNVRGALPQFLIMCLLISPAVGSTMGSFIVSNGTCESWGGTMIVSRTACSAAAAEVGWNYWLWPTSNSPGQWPTPNAPSWPPGCTKSLRVIPWNGKNATSLFYRSPIKESPPVQCSSAIPCVCSRNQARVRV